MPSAVTRVAVLCVALLGAAFAPGVPAAAGEGQALDASFERDSVAVADGPQTATLHVAGASDSVTVRSANVSADLLASMVDGTPTGDGGVRVSVPADGDLAVRFPAAFECRPGRYGFSIADGDATATAAITVTAPADADAGFTAGEQSVSEGENAEIGVAVERCASDRVSLVVGNASTPVRATVSVTNAEAGDVTGAIRFDPQALTGPDAFTAANLTITNASVGRAPPNGTLAPGSYPLALYDGGTLSDVATLVVEPTERPDSTPSGTATPTTGPPPTDGTASEPTGSPTLSDTASLSADSPAPDGSTTGTGVGFTPTAALLALVAALLALSRRA